MDVVCEVCGAVGFKRLLVLCKNCKDSIRHRYCMDTIVYGGPVEWSCDDCVPKHQKQQNHIQMDPSITSESDVDRVEATKELQPWGQRRYRSPMSKRPNENFQNGGKLNSSEILTGKLSKHNDVEKEAESTSTILIDIGKCVDGPNCSASIPTLEIKDINDEKAVVGFEPTMNSQMDPSTTSESDVDRVEATKELQPWGRRRYRSPMSKRPNENFRNGGALNSSEILIGKLSKHNDVEKEAESTSTILIDFGKCVDGPNCSASIPTSEIKEDINVEKAVFGFEPTMNSMEGLDLSNEKGLSFPPKHVEKLFPQGTKADSFTSINDYERCHLCVTDNSGSLLQSVERAGGSSQMVQSADQPHPLEVVKFDGSDHLALAPVLESKENFGLENAMGSFEPTLNSRQKDNCGSSSKYVAGSISQGTRTDLFPSSNVVEQFHPSVIDDSSSEIPSEEQMDGSGPILESWKQPDALEVIYPSVKSSIQGSMTPSNYSHHVQQSDQNIGNDHLSPSKMVMRSMPKAIKLSSSSNGQGVAAIDKVGLDRTKCMLDEEFIAPALDDHKRSSLSMAEGYLFSNSDEVNLWDKHSLCSTGNREQGKSMVTSPQDISMGEIHCRGLNERCNSSNIHESSNPKSTLMENQQGSGLQDDVRKTSVHADNMSNANDVPYVNDPNPRCSNAVGVLKKRKGSVLQNNKDDLEAPQVEDLRQPDEQVKKHIIDVKNGVMNQKIPLENCAEASRRGTSNNQVANNYTWAKKQKSIKGNDDGNALLGDANHRCAKNNTAQIASQDVAGDHCSVSKMSVVSTPIDQQCDIPTQPIDEPYWTGIMKIDQDYISLAAHLSNKACKMVQELSRSLPPVMKVAKYPKVKAYPRRLEESESTAENIGLYFFPDNMRPNEDLDRLVQYVTAHSMVLKYVVGFAKLLIFPSVFLPEQSQMFQGKHYLWGVFKRRKARSISDPLVKSQDYTSHVAKKRKGTQDKVQVDTVVQEKPSSQHSILNGNQPSPTAVNDVETELPGDGGKARSPAPIVFGVVDVRTPGSKELLQELKNEGAVVFPGYGLAKPVPIKL